ncbi:hypothetical protein OH768_21790 [Streptomyces sp. NBC_01622]|nr:hypothetical protein OH768_21790 [Streptomyces sp. NBC_01622]
MKVLIGGLAALALALSLAAGHAPVQSSERASVSASSAQTTDLIDWP